MDLRHETFEAFKRFKEQFDKWVAGLVPQEQELIHRFGERLIIEKIKTQPLPVVERDTDKLPVVRPGVLGEVGGHKIMIAPHEITRGMFVLGGNGTGKTRGVLVPLVLQAIERNEGCLFLDPHGTGIDDVLSLMPEKRVKDVVYLEPGRMTNPPGINPLVSSLETRDADIYKLMDIFKRLFENDQWGQNMENLIRSFIIAAIHSHLTLAELPYFFNDSNFRRKVVEAIPDTLADHYAKLFWKEEYEKAPQNIKERWLTPVTNRTYQFLETERMIEIISQEKNTLDFSELMRQRKIILLHLSESLLQKDAVRFLGTLFVSEIMRASFARTPGKEPLFTCVIDEFATVSSTAFIEALPQVRKFNVGFVLAGQTFSQLEYKLQGAIKQLGTQVTFACTPEDAKVRAILYSLPPEPTYTEKEKKVVAQRPLEMILGRTHSHEVQKVNTFLERWRDPYILSHSYKGKGKSVNENPGWTALIVEILGPSYSKEDSVIGAWEEIEALNTYLYEVMSGRNPPFPLLAFFRLIKDTPCFDKQGYWGWQLSNDNPPHDYCSILLDTVKITFEKIQFSSDRALGGQISHYTTKTRPISAEEIKRAYERALTGSFGEYETLVRKILRKDLDEKEVDRIVAQGKLSFEQAVREVMQIKSILVSQPITTGSGIMEMVETGHVTQQEMITRMERELVKLPARTAYIHLSSQERSVRMTTVNLATTDTDLEERKRIVSEQTKVYGTPRATIEEELHKRRVAHGLIAGKKPSAPLVKTVKEEKRPLTVALSFNDDLSFMLYYFHFLSLDQIIRLLGKKPTDRNHLRERMKKDVFIAETDWKIPGKPGKPLKVYSLSDEGLKHIEAEYGLKSGSRAMALSAHTMIVTEALVQFASLPRFVPEIQLVGFTHERTFKAKAIKLDQGGLEPDGLVRYSLSPPYGNGQLNLYYENDRGFEGKDVWQNKLNKYILALEKGLLGSDRIAIAVCHSGGSIVEWTEEVLSNHKQYAPLVYLTDVDPLTLTPLEVCTNAIWRKPLSTDLAPLLQTSPDHA